MTEPPVQLSAPPDYETGWALFERIATSPQLKRATRLQELLFYIGKNSLKGGSVAIHEQRIGVEVFGRPEGYDTSSDNIVRTSVSELRKRIDSYFESDGADEPLTVEIPRGSYIPVFKSRPAKSASEAQIQQPAELPVAAAAEPARDLPQTSRQPRSVRLLLATAGVMIVVLAIACGYFWNQYRVLHKALYAWQYEPSVAAFWNGIFNANPDTDIVLADASYGLLQDVEKKSFQFDDYFNRSYISQLETQNQSPEMRTIIDRIVRWNVGSQDEFLLAHRILTLDPLGKKIHLYTARSYVPDLSKRDNVILIGGRISNPWDDLFEARMNFTVKFDNNGFITVVNRAPGAGEQASYPQMNSLQYCVIGYLPNPNHNGAVLMIEGTGAEATEAAGDFLLSESQLANLKKTLHGERFPYFEVLLKVTSVQGTPLTATVEAYRAYPDLH